jgi:hypothetical protein
MVYVGIDNGVGSIGIIKDGKYFLYKTPVKKTLDYCKTKVRWINRLDVDEFEKILKEHIKDDNYYIFVERPLLNSKLFFASITSVRILEAMIIVFEKNNYKYEVIDSKKWQKMFINVKGRSNIKKVVEELGKRMFGIFEECKEYDGLFIAEYCRRIGGNND